MREPGFILLDTIRQDEACDAYMLPVSGFPIPEGELHGARWLLDVLTSELTTRKGAVIDVFLQLFQFSGAKDQLHRSAPRWRPKLGLGVWPDREPPSLWTREDFLKLMPGERIRPPMYELLMITGPVAERNQARNAVLPFGSVIQVISPDSADLLARARQLLLPRITHGAFANFPYYVPLLEGHSLRNASAEQLQQWFCGAMTYIRESEEDHGILIASPRPLGPVFKLLGGEQRGTLHPAWRIPVATTR
jgi:hypothetical protein